MNKAIPEIQESAEALKEALRGETRSRQMQRLQALYLLKTGQAKSRTQVGRLLGVSRKTVGDWLERYEAEGLGGLLSIRTHTNRSPSLTPEQKERLSQQLSKPEGFSSYGAVQVWVKQTFGLDLPYTTLYGIVRGERGAKLKVARKSHTKKQSSG